MKRFYNNTIMSGAFSKVLRVFALLCVLLGVSGSAWGASTVTIYFDNTNTQWPENSIYLYMGHASYSRSDWQMTKVSGNIFKCDNVTYWDDATEIAFAKDQWSKSGEGKSLTDRLPYQGDKNYTKPYGIDKNNGTAYIYIPTLSNGVYTLTQQDYSSYVPTCSSNVTTIYFKNTVNWSGVYAYLYNSEYWNDTNGSGSKGIKAGPLTMTLCSGSGTNAIYKCDYPSGHNGFISFTEASQSNDDNFHNTKAAHRGDLCGTTGNMFVPSTTSNGTWNGTVYYSSGNWENHSGDCDGGGGGSGDDDDDDVTDCNSEEIQIWCKAGQDSDTDVLWCYAWENGNDSNQPLGPWCGSQKQTTGTYNDDKYAVWTVSGVDELNVIFNNCNGKQTADHIGLKKGYRYIYDLTRKPDGTSLADYHSQLVYSQRNACGGGDVEEVHNGSLYLSLMNFEGWTADNAIMKARMIKSNGSADIINLVQCTTEPSIYYFENVVNLADYTKVQMLRTNPADGATWNSSAEHTFTATNVCVYITGWDNSSNISVYNGSCTVTDSYVLIGKKAEVSQDGQSVSLYGYLSSTLCNANITEYGFVYCQGTATQGCTPSRNSPRIRVTENVTHLVRGEEFSIKDYSGLVQGFTYGYKAYVMMNDMMMLSDETGYFTLADCTTRPVKGEPITYTVDASLGVTYENPCTLTYGSLETAIKRLKESYEDENEDYQYVTKNGDSYNLNQDVTMNVRFFDDSPDVTGSAYAYAGTKKVTSAGSDKVDGGTNLALLIDFINLNATDDYTLTIKADNPNAQPWVHHPIIRNSRNITLDGLAMYSDPSGKINDCAFEIDVNTTKWDGIQLGQVADANILIKNCYIGSSGFSGVHVSGYDGVTFVNNEFEATFDKGTSNDKEWGASAKFMTTKNVKFINNNFRGDHCTLLWIQECQNMLFMNNVFWNTNKFMDLNYTPSAIRLVTQFGTDLQNIGVFYNTSYFAANTTTSASKYDFMSFKVGSSATSGGNSDFKVDAIYFKYNNCYSYDVDCPGRSDSPFLGIALPDANFCGNNFWSEYDVAQGNDVSAFKFGCGESKFVDVSAQVCETTATGPASLVIKGEDLNLGTPLTAEEILDATEITVTEEEVTSDRYNEAIRKDVERWTLGAYQQGESKLTKVIIWQGVTSNVWDDRNNWIDAETGVRLTCLNNLAADLKVIIPSANSEVYPTPSHGVLYWPNIPGSFDADLRANATATAALPGGIPTNEQVTANVNEFAKTIELEYGAGITGVENLVDTEKDQRHYTNAITNFEAMRKQWILVGTVIMPWDNELQAYRNIKSGDYFIKNQEPHVYMHAAKLVETSDGITGQWDETFADLTVEVKPTTVFAIQLPDQYGKYKLPAAYYQGGNKFNPDQNYLYSFDGKFVNDEALPYYTGLTAGQPALLNNSYPANIDARQIESLTGGKIQYYNYESGTFHNTDATTDAILLRPQHGFIFTPAEGKNSLPITTEMIAGGDTKTRSVEVTLPTLSLNLFNANTGVGYSNVVVKVDEMLAEGEQAPTNVEKVFAPNYGSPELYILANDARYSRFTTNSNSVVIPLGIRLKQDMNIKFERAYFSNFSEAILTDIYTGKEINLLRNTYTTETLLKGDIEDRFFLNLKVAENDYKEDEDNGIITDVEDVLDESAAINIYVEDKGKTIKVVSVDANLQTIYVSDMTGRTDQYNVSGNAVSLRLPVAQGVYMVHVVADNATKTEKVILK